MTTFKLPRGLRFFNALGRQLALFPPPARDRAALRRFARVGIGPGMRVTGNRSLSRDTVRGLQAAVAAGPGQIKEDLEALFKADFEKHDGYLLGGFGSYGTDYRLRAVVATIGLGAFTSEQAIYAMSATDRTVGSARRVRGVRPSPGRQCHRCRRAGPSPCTPWRGA